MIVRRRGKLLGPIIDSFQYTGRYDEEDSRQLEPGLLLSLSIQRTKQQNLNNYLKTQYRCV